MSNETIRGQVLGKVTLRRPEEENTCKGATLGAGRIAPILVALGPMRDEVAWPERGKWMSGGWPIEIGLWIASASVKRISRPA